jgi:hypothetical protein
MNKLLTTVAAVVFAASAGIAGAQAPGKGEMKAAPGSPAAAPAPAPTPAPAGTVEAGPMKGSPTAESPDAKPKKVKKAKKARKSRKAKQDETTAPATK